MTTELTPQYNPQSVEKAIYSKWLSAGVFHAKPDYRPSEKCFSMVIPPPNVTGALHLGHAINATIQDIMARYHRMNGDNTLWMPGIDHAGIATQAVVERTIFEQEKKNRHDLGRDELVRRIWEWKEKFGNRILEQLQAVGASCDWDRTRFTLDDVCARAVREAFFKLFKDGLIFRGLRLVNWDTHLQTAVADDEIYHEAIKGQMTSIRYPVADRRSNDPEYLIVATTRPETMLGDTAVAVYPDDPRYRHLIGCNVIVPLVGRKIPIIGDGLLVDPKFGTGVVKVTPAHDPNDYATGLRHHLPQINLLTPDGKMNASGAGEFRDRKFDYTGLKFSSAARKLILEDLEKLGLIERTEPHEHQVGHSDRSKTPIEPYLSEQWFVKMGDVEGGITLGDGSKATGLAQAAIDAVKSGKVKITPERYTQGYIDWLSQKRDWCISRQLWWGHRIPVWTVRTMYNSNSNQPDLRLDQLEPAKDILNSYLCDCGILKENYTIEILPDTVTLRIISSTTLADEAISILGELLELNIPSIDITPANAAHHRKYALHHTFMGKQFDKHRNNISKYIYEVKQDPDVLDTWFSSALWPLSTMGWPGTGTSDKPEDQLLAHFYPTSMLSTAREILSLWVARMVMFGLYCHGEVPFIQVYIHAVIQDGQGRPMKKSLGNGVDPVDIAESHGADALRFTLASMATETQDIRLPVVKDKVTGKNTSPRFDVGRNFANKIWNASRFILSNVELTLPPTTEHIRQIAKSGPVEDQWILHRLNQTIARVHDLITKFRFAELCTELYSFFWNDLCDWYLEIAKSRIRNKDKSVQAILLYGIRTSLALLHPVMPFVTEAIWEKLPGFDGLLIINEFPSFEADLHFPASEEPLDLVQRITRTIRDIRNQYNIDLKQILDVVIQTDHADTAQAVRSIYAIIEPLAVATIREVAIHAAKPENAATGILPGIKVYVAGIVNRQDELIKLGKRREELEKLIASARTKLANDAFVGKAPAQVVQGLKDLLSQQESQLAAVQSSLTELISS